MHEAGDVTIVHATGVVLHLQLHPIRHSLGEVRLTAEVRVLLSGRAY